MALDITKRCSECRDFFKIRDMHPNGDGTYICMDCEKDSHEQNPFWELTIHLQAFICPLCNGERSLDELRIYKENFACKCCVAWRQGVFSEDSSI